jgi:TolB-like protein
MRRALVLTLIFGGVLAVRSAAAQGTAIAVLPFENGGSYGQDKENFEALEVGIQAALIAELSRNAGARVVARQDVKPGAARADAAGAARAGKAAGARYAVFGNFIDHYGRFRLNARVVDAESGEIIRVVSNDDAGLQDRRELQLILYGRGLLHEDRGENGPAADFYRKAIEAHAGYAEAREGLRRTGP